MKYLYYVLMRFGRNYLSDKLYLDIYYRLIFGRKIDFKNPKSFNEKLQWLKLNDRKPYYTDLVDKFEAKRIVSDIIGEQYIIPTIGIYDSWDEINIQEIKEGFVIKCTHNSGNVIICPEVDKINYNETRKIIKKSLRQNFFKIGREWPYKNVRPRIIVEKYLADNVNDYKFFCFNGVVKCCMVCTERKTELKVTFFDIDWNIMPFIRKYRNDDSVKILKPKCLSEMIDIARKLSENIPFVRVDLYEINEKVYFGEMTFYPGCGFERFTPEEWDYTFGSWINLPSKV